MPRIALPLIAALLVLARPALADSTAAAAATAGSDTNACAAMRPFYWEVGDASGALASGSVGGRVDADTTMAIASASKWLYGAYVVERRGGEPTATDIAFLTFTSGFASFDRCRPLDTVGSCATRASNSAFDPLHDGRFFYGGAHMQQHAEQQMGLGAHRNGALAAEMQRVLGADIGLSYFQPQLAGGARTTAADYARFLRKLLRGDLKLGAQLGRDAVCTNPTTCTTAASSPIPVTLGWHYSLGHWVEDDPSTGDGAFSSPGAFGFYPWIGAGRTHYGVLARVALARGAGAESAACGRLIRKAWVTGVAL